MTIDNNNLNNNYYEGIYVYEIGTGSDDYTDQNVINITNNTINSNGVDSGDEGLYLSEIDYDAEVNIENNTITNNGDEGVMLEYLGQEGGAYWGNGDYPDFRAPRINVKNNTITGNSYSGIYQYDDWQYGVEVTIEGNNISNNGEYGIYDNWYLLDSGAVVTTKDNEINNNALGGIAWAHPIKDGAFNMFQATLSPVMEEMDYTSTMLTRLLRW